MKKVRLIVEQFTVSFLCLAAIPSAFYWLVASLNYVEKHYGMK